MQSLLIHLTVATSAWVAPAPADHPAVQHFQQLDRAGQQQFLNTWLVGRFDAAARIALDELERQSQTKKFNEVLRRFAAGQSLSTHGIRQLLSDVATVEQAAIDQLSLRYRVQVYNRFRTNRAEYDRRMSAWRGLMAEWKSAPSRIADGAVVIDWLTRTLHRLQYDEAAPLPSLPQLGGHPFDAIAAPGAGSGQLQPALEPAVGPQRAPATPPDVAATPRVSPTPPSPLQPPSPPRIAHRVEKPPIPQVTAPPRAVAREVQPIVAPPTAPHQLEPSADEPRVMVDIEELAIRVRGYNLAMKELTADLQDESRWSPEQLQRAFAQFEDLATRRTQLVLYRDLVSRDDRQLIGNLMSLDPPVALLGGKIFAARTNLTRDAASADANAELELLDSLSRKLAMLAAQRAE